MQGRTEKSRSGLGCWGDGEEVRVEIRVEEREEDELRVEEEILK